MAEFILQPATRKAVAPKVLLSGASGSGKTLSALLLAAVGRSFVAYELATTGPRR